MRSPLLPCPSCTRHVRATGTTWPFCGDALALTSPPLRRAPKGLTRAALFAGATMLAGCGAGSSADEPPADESSGGAEALGDESETVTSHDEVSAEGEDPEVEADDTEVEADDPSTPPEDDGNTMHTLYGGPPADEQLV